MFKETTKDIFERGLLRPAYKMVNGRPVAMWEDTKSGKHFPQFVYGAARNDLIKGVSEFYEDFLGPANAASGSEAYGKVTYSIAGSTTFSQLSINGGAARAACAGDEGDAVGVFGPLAYEPDEAGRIVMQSRIRISDVSVSSVFVGFTDADSDTVVIEDEDGTLNTVATDAFGVLLEGEQEGTWQTVGVQNNTDNAQAAGTNLVSDLADATWTTIFIEADASNSGRYRVWVDGKIMTTANTGSGNNYGYTTSALRSSIVFTPCFLSVDDRGSAYNGDICEAFATGGVGTSFD